MTPFPDDDEDRLTAYLRACERGYILAALRRHQGCCTSTCQWLGISRRCLYDKMKEYNLHRLAAAMRARGGVTGPRKGLSPWTGWTLPVTPHVQL